MTPGLLEYFPQQQNKRAGARMFWVMCLHRATIKITLVVEAAGAVNAKTE